MNTYDLTVVLDGKATAAKKKAFVEKIEKLVKTLDGKAKKANDLGQKDLAYPMGKSTSGVFLQVPLELDRGAVSKLNDKLRVDDSILRYLLVRKDQPKADKN